MFRIFRWGEPLAAFSLTLFIAAVVQAEAIPAPWRQSDVGAVGVAGSAAENAGTWAFYGSGADIWGDADAFHFAYQRLNGDVQIVAKVTSVIQTNDWAKAGVMIREDLTAGSKNAFVCMTPANGVAFQFRAAAGGTSANANITGYVAPYWVKLVRNGNQFMAFRSPDGAAWNQVGAAQTIAMSADVYVGLAATSHDNARLGSASYFGVQVSGAAPPVANTVLLVAGSSLLTAADAVVKRRLEALGYPVVVKDAASAAAADATGKILVVISSTVTASAVNTKFTNTAVPVLTWENAILGNLGMTGNVSGTDYGTTADQNQAAIYSTACDRARMYTAATGHADGCHDLAAGLYGVFTLLNQSGTVSWGKPGAAAVQIAYQPGNPAHALEFAYDKGAAMPGLAAAPARRVFLYMSDLTAGTWTGRGQSLFDKAVYWAMGTRYSVTKKVLLLVFDPVLATKGNVLLSAYGSAHWGWPSDPMVLAKDYLADLTEASGGYVRWQIAEYPGIPDLLNRWSPITASKQFNSPGFTEKNYLDAYQHAMDTWDWVGTQKLMPDSGNFQADYNKIMDDYGVDAKINAGEVDEVVLWGFPFAGYWESSMGGRTSYWINGSPFYRNTPNFFAMGYNYERTVGLALHAFGHRAEQLVGEHAFGLPQTLPYNGCYWPDFTGNCGGRQPTPQRNIYDRFSVVEGNLADGAGVGAIHWPPNVLNRAEEYFYDKGNLVYSMADDWLFNYPSLQGPSTRRLVNNSEWIPMAQDAEPQRGFVKWYFQHLPRLQGRYLDPANASNNGKLNNWWEYVVDFNLYPETQR